MEWIKVSIDTTKQASEAVIALLLKYGSKGVQIEDENTYVIISYFTQNQINSENMHNLQTEVKNLSKYGLDYGTGKIEITNENDKNWRDLWKKHYHPYRVTRYLTVSPSWEEYLGTKDEKVIYLDPKNSFGTGTHPTTILAIRALESHIRGYETVLDVGSGSGVLSIAAKYLGARKVDAFDLEDVAIIATKNNLRLNKVDKEINVFQNDLLSNMSYQADVIIANILADVIEILIPQAYLNLKGNGTFIISGIIENKKEVILERLKNNGFIPEEILNMKDWYAIVSKKVGEK